MSLPRATLPLQRWSFTPPWLCPSRLCQSSSSYSNNHVRASLDTHALPKRSRPFHSSTSCNAVPSPTTRRAQKQQKQQRQVVPSSAPKSWFRGPEQLKQRESRRATFASRGEALFYSARLDGIIPYSLSFDTYKRVADELIDSCHSNPSAMAIRAISKDVDLVFNIGSVAFISDNAMLVWLYGSALAADGVVAILGAAGRILTTGGPHGLIGRVDVLGKLERLALRDRDPRALILYAKYLGMHKEQYAKALEIIEEVLEGTHPLQHISSPDENLVSHGIDPPWQVYAWLKERKGEQTATDEILKMAALKYEEPAALNAYSTLMMQEGNLEMYEECLSKAAGGGNSDACRRLANFYYLTFHGRFPPRGSKELPDTKKDQGDKPTPKNGGFLSALGFDFQLFGRLRSRAEYRLLAFDWYELAVVHGDRDAALILSLLFREEGAAASGLILLDYAEKSEKLAALARKYRANWYDKEWDPKFPTQLLDV